MTYHILSFLFALSVFCLITAAIRIRHEHGNLDKMGRLKGMRGEMLCGELLDSYGGVDRLHNIVVAKTDNTGTSGRQHCSEIDSLVFCQSHVLVIETKAWSGRIYGRLDDEFWSIRLNNGRMVTRKNPLVQVRQRAALLRDFMVVPESRIMIAVIMTGGASFDDPVLSRDNGLVFTKSNIASIRHLTTPWSNSNLSANAYIASCWSRCASYTYSRYHDYWSGQHKAMITRLNKRIPVWALITVYSFCVAVTGVFACVFAVS